MSEEKTTTERLHEEHGATEEDPGRKMAQDTAAQYEASLEYDRAADEEAASGPFTVVDQTGATQEIVRKEARGEDIVLVNAEGAAFVASTGGDIGDLMGVVPYEMESDSGTIYDEGNPEGPTAEEAAEAGDAVRSIDREGDSDLQEIGETTESSYSNEEVAEQRQEEGGKEAPPATEAAEELAAEEGVELSEVEGSGVDGKITKPDVQAELANDEAEG